MPGPGEDRSALWRCRRSELKIGPRSRGVRSAPRCALSPIEKRPWRPRSGREKSCSDPNSAMN
eukprot:12278371-Alexandrium_andersonii.AAC.1